MTIHDSESAAKPKKKSFWIAIALIVLAAVLIIAFASILYFSGSSNFSLDFPSSSPYPSPSPIPTSTQTFLDSYASPAITPIATLPSTFPTSYQTPTGQANTPSLNPTGTVTSSNSPTATLEPEKYSTATEVREHLIIKNMKNNSTSSQLIMLDVFAGRTAKVGSQFSIDIPYHNEGTGVLNIVNIVCNTSGFSLAGVSPALPVTLPNSVTYEEGNVTLRISFASPSEQYVGSLDFTVYYEYYPSYHNFTSVTETLIYTLYGSPMNVPINLNTLVGEWVQTGSQFTLNIPYQNAGYDKWSITNIVCNTTGFSVAQITPTLPAHLPQNPTDSITLQIIFNSPTTAYTGPFNFTVYFEPYT